MITPTGLRTLSNALIKGSNSSKPSMTPQNQVHLKKMWTNFYRSAVKIILRSRNTWVLLRSTPWPNLLQAFLPGKSLMGSLSSWNSLGFNFPYNSLPLLGGWISFTLYLGFTQVWSLTNKMSHHNWENWCLNCRFGLRKEFPFFRKEGNLP